MRVRLEEAVGRQRERAWERWFSAWGEKEGISWLMEQK